MNVYTTSSKSNVIATVEFLPAVSIIIPFNPVTAVKKKLELSLKNVQGRIEAMLLNEYSVKKSIPVIFKLRKLFSSLNYNSTKKSIAIFVSPIAEKVYYLGVEVDESLVIDPSFKIRDVVYCKKEKKEFLILLLCERFSRMYWGDGKHLTLIKSNTAGSNTGDNCNAEENFSGISAQDELITNNFLLQMDEGLSIILKSYPLPVIVMGPEKLLEHFKTITQNNESLVQFIEGSNAKASEAALGCVMEHVVCCWKDLKQEYLLKQMEKAKTGNKLTTGLRAVMKAAAQNRGKLLMVEKKYAHYAHTSKTHSACIKLDCMDNEDYFIKDDVDEIIKNVLESGGDVEFINDGLLKNYRHIALIEKP